MSNVYQNSIGKKQARKFDFYFDPYSDYEEDDHLLDDEDEHFDLYDFSDSSSCCCCCFDYNKMKEVEKLLQEQKTINEQLELDLVHKKEEVLKLTSELNDLRTQGIQNQPYVQNGPKPTCCEHKSELEFSNQRVRRLENEIHDLNEWSGGRNHIKSKYKRRLAQQSERHYREMAEAHAESKKIIEKLEINLKLDRGLARSVAKQHEQKIESLQKQLANLNATKEDMEKKLESSKLEVEQLREQKPDISIVLKTTIETLMADSRAQMEQMSQRHQMEIQNLRRDNDREFGRIHEILEAMKVSNPEEEEEYEEEYEDEEEEEKEEENEELQNSKFHYLKAALHFHSVKERVEREKMMKKEEKSKKPESSDSEWSDVENDQNPENNDFSDRDWEKFSVASPFNKSYSNP